MYVCMPSQSVSILYLYTMHILSDLEHAKAAQAMRHARLLDFLSALSPSGFIQWNGISSSVTPAHMLLLPLLWRKQQSPSSPLLALAVWPGCYPAIIPLPQSVGPLTCSLRMMEQSKSQWAQLFCTVLVLEAGCLYLWVQESLFIAQRRRWT